MSSGSVVSMQKKYPRDASLHHTASGLMSMFRFASRKFRISFWWGLLSSVNESIRFAGSSDVTNIVSLEVEEY